MRIDPKETVAGYPALLVRGVLRRLRSDVHWDLARLEAVAALPAAEVRDFVKALVAAGLAEAAGSSLWSITQAGQTLSSATAAPRVTRATAERALREFLDRVDRVNRDRYYLGRVAAVVLFGSMLKPEVARLSDVDVAVEIVPKEANLERARAQNEKRAIEVEGRGRRFRGLLDRQFCWYREVFAFLKGRSRVISMADLRQEGEFVLSLPHRVLYSAGDWKPYTPPIATEVNPDPLPPDEGCPF
jgi:predicted nucleotidyltransferase